MRRYVNSPRPLRWAAKMLSLLIADSFLTVEAFILCGVDSCDVRQQGMTAQRLLSKIFSLTFQHAGVRSRILRPNFKKPSRWFKSMLFWSPETVPSPVLIVH